MKKRNIFLILLIGLLLIFPLFFNKYNFVSNIGNPILTQSIEDEKMWKEYISLKLYRTIITPNMSIEEKQYEILKSQVFIDTYAFSYTVSDYRGSGFVIDIDENNIYIATNEHVAHLPSGRSNGYHIRFSNNIDKVNEIIETYYLKGEYIGATYNPDYAIIKIDISNVPYNERYVFKAVPKIEEIQLEQGMPIYMYRIKKECNETLKQGTLKSLNLYNWSDGSVCYQVTPICISGDSGSYVFTENGNCLGMLLGTHYNDASPTDTIITYSQLVDTFETIVGRPLYPEENLEIEQSENTNNSLELEEEINEETILYEFPRNRYEEINPTTYPIKPIWYIE